MASDIWLRTILIVREETRCRHIGYSFRLAARVPLYAPSHRQDSTYHGFCYTSRGALAGSRNRSMGPPHEGSIRRPSHHERTLLPLSYVLLRFCLDDTSGWSITQTTYAMKAWNRIYWVWIKNSKIAARSWICSYTQIKNSIGVRSRQ